MRALIVLLALVTTPFLASVSQNLTGSPQRDVKATNGLGHNEAHCAARWGLHPDRDVINKCPTAGDGGGTGSGDTGGTGSGDTGGTGSGDTGGSTGGGSGGGDPAGGGATCVDSPAGTGTVSVRGQVYVDDGVNYPYVPGPGWCVELRDFLSGAVVATAVPATVALDGELNNFVFMGVASGSYVICEVLPPNTTWHQTWPTGTTECGARAGYLTGLLGPGATSTLNWFGNLQ